MSVTITGTATAPAAVLTHNEPTSPYGGGAIPAGTSQMLSVGPFKNTGNVNQTLHLLGVSGLSNCQISEFFITHDGIANDGHLYTLTPGSETMVSVNVSEPNTAPGTPNTPYSFSLDTSWS